MCFPSFASEDTRGPAMSWCLLKRLHWAGSARKGNKNNFHHIIWIRFLFQNVNSAYELMTGKVSPPLRSPSLHCIPPAFTEVSTAQVLSNNSSALASYYVVKNVTLTVPSCHFQRGCVSSRRSRKPVYRKGSVLYVYLSLKSLHTTLRYYTCLYCYWQNQFCIWA